jgi:hypothetical protein
MAVHFGAGGNPTSVAVADFNGDGRADLAVGNLGGDEVSVLLGNGDGAFEQATNYRTDESVSGVAVADFDGDGFPDLAASNRYANNVSVLRNAADWASSPSRVATGRPGSLPAVSVLLNAGALDLASPVPSRNPSSALLEGPPVVTKEQVQEFMIELEARQENRPPVVGVEDEVLDPGDLVGVLRRYFKDRRRTELLIDAEGVSWGLKPAG